MMDDWVKWILGIIVPSITAGFGIFNIRLNRAEDARLKAEEELNRQLELNSAALAAHRVSIAESLAKYPDRAVISEMELRIRTDQQDIRTAINRLSDNFMSHVHRTEQHGND